MFLNVVAILCHMGKLLIRCQNEFKAECVGQIAIQPL